VGATTVQLNRTFSSPNSTVLAISVISAFNNSYSIPISNTSWTIIGTNISFPVTLPSGSYNIQVSSPNGYYLINSVLNVQMPSNVVNTTQTTSFAGGAYTLTANTLSPVSYILVNGFKGFPTATSVSSVTYTVPPLVTSASQASFNLASVGLINMGLLSYFSDQTTSNVSLAFDGITTTLYGSPNSACWIGMDAGSGLQISVSRIRFFPYLGWTNTVSKILYAQFQGSNDNTTWTTLAIIDQTVHSGYNTILSTVTTPYRYIRFLHSSISQCNIA
jgi:hypothetical protein